MITSKSLIEQLTTIEKNITKCLNNIKLGITVDKALADGITANLLHDTTQELHIQTHLKDYSIDIQPKSLYTLLKLMTIDENLISKDLPEEGEFILESGEKLYYSQNTGPMIKFKNNRRYTIITFVVEKKHG